MVVRDFDGILFWLVEILGKQWHNLMQFVLDCVPLEEDSSENL